MLVGIRRLHYVIGSVMGIVLFVVASTAYAKYTPTSGYEIHHIRGWKIYVNRNLLDNHKDLAIKALELLNYQLYQITRVVPKKALHKIQTIPIWLEYKDSPSGAACYHPSRKWLETHGYNPDKAGCVEISNAGHFLSWTIQQPWMVMHELAHAYHHHFLGYNNKAIKKAFRDAVESHKYDSVLNINGKKQKHYAMNNEQEYFAESTEAYFGTNDFYPFVRAELKQFDPEMYQVVKHTWQD